MHRRSAVIDDRSFAAFDAVLHDGFCLCAMMVDEAGQAIDYRFLRVNRLFESMTGLADAEGRSALELVPGLERHWIEAYARVGLGGETLRFEQGSVAMGRVFEVLASPIEPKGCFALVFRDVTALRRAEEERESSLRDAQALLAELNHRVMNSFASISAIVGMEARAASPESRPALERVSGRVQALGALYRRLDGATRIDRIEMSDYLEGVVSTFRDSLGAGLAVDADIEPLTLPTRKALPLALVANELLTDVARRAGGTWARVRVALAATGDGCALEVSDDAPSGAPEEAQGRRRDVGRSLVAAFVAELGGQIDVAEDGAGRRARVDVPLP